MRNRISVLTGLLLLSLFLPARAAEMVEDLNPGVTAFDSTRVPAARFFSYTPVNGRVVFLGFLGSDGIEASVPECGLWTTDGTAEGTEQLAELCGEADTLQDTSRIRILGTNGSVALFTDRRGRIWRTDGTAAGTFQLGNVTSEGPVLVGPDGRTFFFAGCNRPFGCEPWKSDGTREGTAMIRDLRPGRKSSDPTLFTRGRGRVLFAANRRSLWATDGTAGGTVELARNSDGVLEQILPHGGQVFFTTFLGNADVWVVGQKPESLRLVQSLPSAFRLHSGLGLGEAGGRVFITRVNDDGTSTLWETDGTSRGTRPLALIEDQLPLRFFALGGNRVVFAASREEGKYPQLWYLDPGMKSPRRLGSPRVLPQYQIQLGDRLFFIAIGPDHGASLWVTDGTREGTRLVQDLCPGACQDGLFLLRTVRGHLFFTDLANRLWTTDESGEDPVLLSQFLPAGHDGLLDLAPLRSGQVVFSGFDEREGPQPWVSDLTPEGTDRILPLGTPLAAGSRIWSLTPFGDKVLFTGCDGESFGLFVSDGTAAGTFLLANLQEPAEGPCALYHPSAKFTVLGNVALFYVDGKLWRTDGTPGGTSPLLTLNLPFLRGSAKLGGQLLFVLDPPDLLNHRVWSFWTSDGTEAGTRQVFELPLAGSPFGFVSVGEEVFFIAQSTEPPFPYTLWRTDGTEAGTRQLLVINYPISGGPIEAVRLGGKTVLTLGGSGSSFVDFWVTDGTAAGTVPVIADPAAPGPKNPFGLTVWKDAVWFFTGTGKPGEFGEPFAFWQSDGTAAGTRLVKNVSPPRSEYGFLEPLLTPVGDTLFFRADDGVHGSELWKTDGTAEGTVLVQDIAPGAANAHPSALATFGGKLWFAATDGVHGLELWQSDGTAAGTRLVEDIFPGPNPSAPEQLTAVPGKLFFTANDGVHGRELWLETSPH